MKKVYIAHPLRGTRPYSDEQCQENIERINLICKTITDKYRNVVPMSPIHAFGFLDPLHCDQELAIKYCFGLLDGCDELWLFEGWESSSGCIKELKAFVQCGKGKLLFTAFDEDELEIEPLNEISFKNPDCYKKLIDILMPVELQ